MKRCLSIVQLLLLEAMDGKIVLDGIYFKSVSEKLLPGVRIEKIGFIFQNYNLIPTLSVLAHFLAFIEAASSFRSLPFIAPSKSSGRSPGVHAKQGIPI